MLNSVDEVAMKQMQHPPFLDFLDCELREAQRIIDDVRDNPLHPANDRRHPLHRQALEAIFAREEKVFKLAVPDNILRINRSKASANNRRHFKP
jgi:hypothetical protein